MFSLLAWTSCGRNSRVAGDMRHHDLTVMILFTLLCYVLVNFRETSLALGQFYHRQRALSYTLYDEMLLMHIFSGGEGGGWGGVGWSGYISLRPFVRPSVPHAVSMARCLFHRLYSYVAQINTIHEATMYRVPFPDQ